MFLTASVSRSPHLRTGSDFYHVTTCGSTSSDKRTVLNRSLQTVPVPGSVVSSSSSDAVIILPATQFGETVHHSAAPPPVPALPAPPPPPQAQYLLKGVSEVRAAAVDERVEGGVGVAQPVEESEDQLDVSQLEEGHEDVEDEEGQPTQRERAHDNPQGFHRLVLLQTELQAFGCRMFYLHLLRPYPALSPTLLVTGVQTFWFLHVETVLLRLLSSVCPGPELVQGRAVVRKSRGRGVLQVIEMFLPAPDLLQVFLGLLEDPAVDEDHHHQRQVEGDDGGGHGVHHVGGEFTAVLVGQAQLRRLPV